MKNMKYISILLISIFFISCATDRLSETGKAEDVYKKAMEYYNDEDYLDAKQMFDLIKLQYPASQYADDAQFYLAEIHYKREEFILGAFNYNRLRTLYPSSEFGKESLFKAALCFYELSPTFDRDQEYTQKAIDGFNLYQRIYPDDEKYAECNTYIKELRDKLGEKFFSVAALYEKMDYPRSALVYFDIVIDEYPDTKFFEQAYVGKIKTLVILKRFDEAESIIMVYDKVFPEGEYKEDIKSLEKEISAEMNK